MRSVLLWSVLSGCIATSASGQLVYANGVGGASGVSNAFTSDPGVSQRVADDVTFAVEQRVTSIAWTGTYFGGDGVPPALDNFTIMVRSDLAGLPGGVLATFPVGGSATRTDTLVDLSSPLGTFDVFEHQAALDFTFAAGVRHWIEISNAVVSIDDDVWGWAAGATGIAPDSAISRDFGASWEAHTDVNADFRLFVPAPTSAAILGFGGLTMARRHR